MIFRTLMSGQIATRRRIVSIAGSFSRRRRGKINCELAGLVMGRLISLEDDEEC